MRCVAVAWVPLGLVVLMSLGCAKQPPPAPLASPPLEVGLTHYVGTALAGPSGAKPVANVQPGDALAVEARVTALEWWPDKAGDPLASKASMVALTRNGLPVQAWPQLTRVMRVAEGAGADQLEGDVKAAAGTTGGGHRAVEVAGQRGALPAGATVQVQATAPAEVEGTPRLVTVSVSRPMGAGPLTVLVATEGRYVAGEGDTATTRPSAPVTAREVVTFARALAAEDHFALATPVAWKGSTVKALVVDVRIGPGSADVEHAEAVARFQTEAAAAAAQATTRPYFEPINNPEWPAIASALETIRTRGAPRGAMVFVATRAGARVCEDVALVADDATRQAVAKRVSERMGAAGGRPRDLAELAWVMDAAAYATLAEQLSAEQLPAELAAVLTLHAGEAGRHAGSVEEALKAAGDGPAFQLRLIAENYIYLEDASPASRVRAYDWLRARDRAPVGYDPLGPPKQRRDALQNALGATTTNGGNP